MIAAEMIFGIKLLPDGTRIEGAGENPRVVGSERYQ
jgi:hypothetical protein